MSGAIDTLRPISTWPVWAQYALAIGVTLAALGVRWSLEPILGGALPFGTVFAALLLLVLLVRPGPFLAAAVLGGLGALVLFIRPRFTLDVTGLSELVQVILFAVASGAAVTAAWLSHRLGSARRRLDDEYVRRSEELRLITDAVPALISYVDSESRYRFVNAGYVQWFDRRADELVGHSMREVLGDEVFARVRPHAEAALAGEARRFESIGVPDKGGKPRHVIGEYVPDVRADGSVAGFYALVTDVTERREAEAAQARLAALVETSGDAIMSISLTKEILSWNAGAQRLFGYRADEAVGRTIDLVLPAGRADEERTIVERACRGELVGPYDTARRHKDGRLIDVSVTVSPIRDGLGRIIGVSKVDRDITERKRAERAVAESERRLATLVGNLPGAAYRCRNGLDRPIEFISEGVREMFGYGPEEFLAGRVTWAALIHAKDRDKVEQAIAAAVRERRPFRIEYRIQHRDGSQRWVWEQGEPVLDDAGQPAALEGFVTDVTQRKRTERQLEATLARERAYLEHLPVGVWFANERGELTYANAAARRIWGGPQLSGLDGFASYEARWHGTDRRIAGEEWALARAIRLGQTSIGEEIDIVGFDGTRKTILNSSVPVRDVDGQVIGGVVMNLDISEQKRAEQALKDADRRKDEFLATLAHELRNPLAAVRSGVELLVSNTVTEGEALGRITGIVHRQVLMMVRLIDDLLDVSRITHGTLELQTERNSLQALVEQAIDAARPAIEGNGHTLQLWSEPEPIEIDGDAVRLVQVFTNILGNACKYSDPGGRIDVRIARDGGEAAVEIRDHGIGIPPDKLDTIFEMFSQLDATGRGKVGLGLGLALTRRLVELHGGRVTAASEGPGRGSTFTVRLPARAPASVDAEPQPVSAGDCVGL